MHSIAYRGLIIVVVIVLFTTPTLATKDQLSGLLIDLSSSDWYVQWQAVNKLADLGSVAMPAVSVLTNILTDQPSFFDPNHSTVRTATVTALSEIDLEASVDVLLMVLTKDPHYMVRQQAARTLGRIKPESVDEKVIHALGASLNDTERVVRSETVLALRNFCAESHLAVSFLVSALGDADFRIRRTVVESLDSIGESAMEPLLAIIGGDDAVASKEALAFLERQGTRFLPSIIEAIENSSAQVRQEAVSIIRTLGSEATLAVPELANVLINDSNIYVRRMAAQALAKMGTDAIQALPALIDAFNSEDSYLRREVYTAIREVKPEMITTKLVPVLIDASQVGELSNRINAIRTMAEIDAASDEILMNLVGLVSDADLNIRFSAVQAIGELGINNQLARTGLSQALVDTDLEVRTEATLAIGKLRPVSKEMYEIITIPLLSNVLAEQYQALIVLDNLFSQNPLRVPELFTVLGDLLFSDDSDVRLSSMLALEKVKAFINVSDQGLLNNLVVTFLRQEPVVSLIALEIIPQLGKSGLEKLWNIAALPEHTWWQRYYAIAGIAQSSGEAIQYLQALSLNEESQLSWVASLKMSQLLVKTEGYDDQESLGVQDQLLVKWESERIEKELNTVTPLVRDLPEQTRSQILKKAMLEWVLETAQSALEYNILDEAQLLITDINDLINKPIGGWHPSPKGLVAELSNLETNPYVESLFLPLSHRAERVITYAKGEDLYNAYGTSSQIRDRFSDLPDKVWGLTSPQSPVFQNPMLFKQILRDLDALFSLHRNGDFNVGRGENDPNMNRFIFAYANDAYLQLKTVFPDLIPASKVASWEQTIRQGVEWQLATFTQRTGVPHGPFWYPNIDAAWLLMMHIAGEILDEPSYQDLAVQRLVEMGQLVYPDGGLPYLGLSNEEPAYHGVTLSFLARYWQLTNSRIAYEVISATTPYYPLSVERGGVTEGSTSPYWKQRWDAVTPVEVEIVAGITGDPQNKQMARDLVSLYQETRTNIPVSLLAASLYREDIAFTTIPDNYIVYDYNVEGPRGRFGNWSFVATGRDWQDDRGKWTFAGAMVLEDDQNRQHPYPLSGALQLAYSEFLNTPNSGYGLGMNDKNSMVITDRFASFSTVYSIQQPQSGGARSAALPWQGNQQWLMTPERIIGFLELAPVGDQTAYGMRGVIRIGNGRGLPLQQRTSFLTKQSDQHYKLGSLEVMIHDHNYEQIRTTKAVEYRGNSYDILLEDTKLQNRGNEATTYSSGARKWYIVEGFQSGVSPANIVLEMNTDRLSLVEVTSDSLHLVLIHNKTNATYIHHYLLADGVEQVVVYPSVLLGTGESIIAGVSDGYATIELPPFSQVVIEIR